MMKQIFRPALILLLVLSLITGIIYPVVVTALGKLMFPQQVAGSLIVKDGKVIGSALIGQNFTSPRYFWGRPSATAPFAYNAAASSGSNLGPLNPGLLSAVQDRVAVLGAAQGQAPALLPVDMVTASASGLDPEISPAAAMFQVHRVVTERGLTEAKVKQLVESHIQEKQWGLFGESRVNVLQLNLALDALRSS